MRKALKWLGIGLGGLLLILIIVVGGLFISTGRRLSKTYEVTVEPVPVSNDTAVRQRGEHLTTILCTGCHGPDLSGTRFFDDPALGYVPASNLTRGDGGVGDKYDVAGFVRALRHGIGYDNQALFIMPARDFYNMSDEDLGAVIAYLQSLPPVDNELGEKHIQPLARILVAVGAFGDVINAETIDHAGPRPAAPEPGITAVYGEYWASLVGCTTCHGDNLAGGKDPDPAAPPAPNITRGSEVANWSEDDFITAMRTGVTPSGRQMSDFMPWRGLANMTNEELQALWLYLQSLPDLPGNDI